MEGVQLKLPYMQIQATTARGYEYYSIDGNEWNKPNLDT